ncbi:hypothetical protein ACHAPX_000519 [Trichoderma viride]
MPSYPEKANWLTEEEKSIQVLRLGVNSSHGAAKLNWEDAKATLKDVRLYVHYVTYLCIGVGVSSLSLFAPTIVAGLGYKNLQAQLFTIPPYAVAYVVTLVLAMISDHQRTRGLVAGGCFLFGTIAFIIQGKARFYRKSVMGFKLIHKYEQPVYRVIFSLLVMLCFALVPLVSLPVYLHYAPGFQIMCGLLPPDLWLRGLILLLQDLVRS